MRTLLAAVVVAMALAACSSGDGAQVFQVPCGDDDLATHDFGTTDPGVLARVHALTTSPFAGCNEDGECFEPDGGQVSFQEGLTDATVTFVGSTGYVRCTAPSVVTYVLEP